VIFIGGSGCNQLIIYREKIARCNCGDGIH
jgi:hypothetical protein